MSSASWGQGRLASLHHAVEVSSTASTSACDLLTWLCACLQGPIAVIGPGTGLGCANLFWDVNEGGASGYCVHPSEGSHAGFAPRGWRQRALQAFVEQELGRCGVEQVLRVPHMKSDGLVLTWVQDG